MKLTPLDIRHKEFKRGMRGYADVEVDEFLDEVADEYERLFKENIDLHEQVEGLQEKVAGYKRIEDTLQKTLISAQGSAEEVKQNASKEAELVLGEAELKARQMVNDAYGEKQTVEQDTAKLKAAEQDFRFKFRALLQTYLQQIGDDAKASPGEQAEFARRAAAIKEAISREEAGKAPDTTADLKSSPAAQPAPAAEKPPTAPSPPPPAPPKQAPPPEPAPKAAEPAAAKEPVKVGEGDDLLADVDSGVNENEFKW